MSQTPGPWDSQGVIVFNVAGDVIICRCEYGGKTSPEFHQSMENARLIAAAPELLQALKRLRDLPIECSQQEDNAAWDEAHAAIAKAEGVKP